MNSIELYQVAIRANDTKKTAAAQSADTARIDAETNTVIAQEVDQEQIIPTGRPQGTRFALLFVSILLANFAIGYVRIHLRLEKQILEQRTDHVLQDTSCIATLTPVITDQFQALQDLGWYTIA